MADRDETTHRLVALQGIVDAVAPDAVLGDPTPVEVSGVVFDDREVAFGALFCCLPGEHHDGHDFALRARRNGAVAFICEHSLAGVTGAVQLVVAPGSARRAMAEAACAFYANPATTLRTVGVTGTNGKTTTTFLLRSIFEAHGWSADVLGTLDNARTTPESPHLQRALSVMRDRGVEAAALEVTSHALVQHRVDGMVFDVAVFTNLSQDHLDYHQTMEAYFQAKALLFTPDHAASGVVNLDDPYGRRLSERSSIPTIGFSLDDVRDISIGVGSSTFRLGGRQVRLGLGGEFNVKNALAAAATARALGIGPSEIVAGLEAARIVPGRFEAIAADRGVMVVVDFAHTPAGIEEVLRAARQAINPSGKGSSDTGRVLIVFGCGGDRDRGKRPAMGAVASELADVVILTSDNPRSESPRAIIGEIEAGITCSTGYHVEPDRRLAIALALETAAPGDVVVIAGKGHETTQQFVDRTVAFDDREVVREEIRSLARRRDAASA